MFTGERCIVCRRAAVQRNNVTLFVVHVPRGTMPWVRWKPELRSASFCWTFHCIDLVNGVGGLKSVGSMHQVSQWTSS